MSTTDQDASLQVDALTKAGCYRVFVDTGSGSLQGGPDVDRPVERLGRGNESVVG